MSCPTKVITLLKFSWLALEALGRELDPPHSAVAVESGSGGGGPPGRAEAPPAGGADGPGDWPAGGEMAVEKLEATVGREKEGMWALRQVE